MNFTNRSYTSCEIGAIILQINTGPSTSQYTEKNFNFLYKINKFDPFVLLLCIIDI